MERVTLLQFFLIFIILIFDTCSSELAGGKYAGSLNNQNHDLETKPFRMNKINMIWEKAGKVNSVSDNTMSWYIFCLVGVSLPLAALVDYGGQASFFYRLKKNSRHCHCKKYKSEVIFAIDYNILL